MANPLRSFVDESASSTPDLSCFLEAIPETVLLIDDRRRVVGANWRFRGRGGDSDRCLGRSCFELLHQESGRCSRVPADCPLALGELSGSRGATLHLHRAGRRAFYEEVRSTPIGDAETPRLLLQTLRRPGRPSIPAPGRLVGHSPAMLGLRWAIQGLRERCAPIVVVGEHGTERELVARELHRIGPRGAGPFALALDPVTAALRQLAWPTPSVRRAAEEGTLFLDEIDALPRDRQRELLDRLSSPRTAERGGPRASFRHARWIFGSTRPLAEAVRTQRLVPELARHFEHVAVEIPPLRDRIGDLPMLIQALRPWLVAPPELEIDPSVASALATLPLPGNLDELRHRLQNGVLAAGRGTIRPEHLEPWV